MRNRNLVGQVFFDLTVLSKAEDIITPSGIKRSAWLCRCVCGNTTVVTQNALVSGTTKSCGCRVHKAGEDKRIDLSGRVFGDLTVIQLDHIHTTPNNTRVPYYLCKCSCGKEKVISKSSLVNGYVTSCGCRKSKMMSDTRTDLTGKRFGLLTVIEDTHDSNNHRNAIWLCKCDCGNYKKVSSGLLVSGRTSSCGCLGASRGEYRISKILEQFHFDYVREYEFDDLIGPGGARLRFDFAVMSKDSKLLGLIEYQGEQHYKETKDSFGELQRNTTDKMKREYCTRNGIVLAEIPYNKPLMREIRKALIKITSHANPVPRLSNE